MYNLKIATIVAGGVAATAFIAYALQRRLDSIRVIPIVRNAKGDVTRAKGLHERIVSYMRGEEKVAHLQVAFEVLDEAFMKFSFKSIAVAFNGGKDATAALLLSAAVAASKVDPKEKNGTRLSAIYFQGKDEFDQMYEFVEKTCTDYGIDLIIYRDVDFKTGLQDACDRFGFQAFIMGLRRGDPDAKWIPEGIEGRMFPSSPGWPDFMRIHPVIEWKYNQIWDLLRQFKLPYFSLYDYGYTSLGNKNNTEKNPLLLRERRNDIKRTEGPDPNYLPAYCLLLSDEDKERAGRRKK
eukprot:g4255.t1